MESWLGLLSQLALGEVLLLVLLLLLLLLVLLLLRLLFLLVLLRLLVLPVVWWVAAFICRLVDLVLAALLAFVARLLISITLVIIFCLPL